MVGQNCPHWGSRIQCRFAFSGAQRDFSSEQIFRGGIETRGSSRERAETNNSRPHAATEITRYVDCYMWTTDPKCVLADPFASVSSAGNSRLSGQASGCTGHDRRHSSLVGARRLHSKVGAENCRDRRATRRTRFSRRKAICGWQRILPRLPELSRDASASAIIKLSMTMCDEIYS